MFVMANRHCSGREREDGRGARVHRDRFTQGVFPGMCHGRQWGAVVGNAMADHRRGDCGAADALRPAESRRGGSLESDLGVRRSRGGTRRGGARGRYAEDTDQSGGCREDRSPRCAAPRRCAASSQRRRDLLSAGGDPRSARVVSPADAARAAASESETTLARVAPAPRRHPAAGDGSLWRTRDGMARRADARRVGRRQSGDAAAVAAGCPGAIGPGTDGDSRAGGSRTIARALDARPGFGPVFSLSVRAEIGTITRFPDGRNLASYAGLVPRVEGSAGRHWTGRITKAGSPWLRWTLIEAALHNVRRQDDFGRWARRLAVKKGLMKTRVAVARALCDEIVQTWPKAGPLPAPALGEDLAIGWSL